MAVLRTPDARFAALPAAGWPHEPRYFTSSLYGLRVRIAYYDVGPPSAEETVLLTHGEPSWSYLNRGLIAPLTAAGFRVVLFDQVGFGRSDKPARDEDYTYERHVGWNVDLLVNHLSLRGVTAVFQDWGGLLGLRVATAHPDRFRRLVIANTFLPTSDDAWFKVSKGFYGWKDFARRSGLKGPAIAKLMSRGAVGPSNPKMSDAEQLAYDAPYPDESYKAGARRFPELVPTPATDPTGRPQPLQAENNAAAWAVLRAWTKPVLLAFSDQDNVMAGADQIWLDHCPGTKYPGVSHVTIKGGGHFLQDGGREQLARAIADFIRATPAAKVAALRAKM